MTNEIWKPVVGHEQHYEVSSFGRLRSLDRVVSNRTGKNMTRQWRGRVLKTPPNKRGYLHTSISHDGTIESVMIHDLVLRAFVGPPPEGMEGCHNDGIRSNCRLDNLRWDTPVSNQADRIKHGTARREEQHPSAKLNALDIQAIRARYQTEDALTMEALAADFGVSKSTIESIVNYRTWKNVA